LLGISRAEVTTWYVQDTKLYREDKLTILFKRNTRDTYIKNYCFTFDFGPQWGSSSVTMTSVKGHLTELHFPPEYKKWEHPPPDSLFNAPVNTVVSDVRLLFFISSIHIH